MTLYKRLQRLGAAGMIIRRANHFEQKTNEYGEKLTWVISRGGVVQALLAYKTKEHAITAAERYLDI